MTVCKFFLEGRCNFGSTCRNEHPGDAQQRNNRFGATDSNNPLRGRIGFRKFRFFFLIISNNRKRSFHLLTF